MKQGFRRQQLCTGPKTVNSAGVGQELDGGTTAVLYGYKLAAIGVPLDFIEQRRRIGFG